MKLNTLKPADGARKDRVRVGRGIGSGLGKTAGRGHKGSFARAGKGKIKAGFEGGQMPIYKRLPKVGFRSKLKNDTAEVLLYQLDKLEAGEIDFAALRAAKLVPANAKQAKVVKKGELTKKFVLKGLLATAGAKAAVEAAGPRRGEPGGIERAHPRIRGLQLGLGDLFEPHGIRRSALQNVHAAQYALRMAAAEAGVFAYDAAFPGLEDEAGFRAEAESARALGYVGKSCVHPRQVAWANAAFSPSEEEIEAARRIVGAATADGSAFAVDGRMVDAPFLARARAVLATLDREPR